MPDPTHYTAIGWVLVSVVALITGVNQVMRLVDRVRGHPPNEQLQHSADNLAERIMSLEASLQLRPTAESVKLSVDLLGARVGQLENHRQADDKEASNQRQRLYSEVKGARQELEGHIDRLQLAFRDDTGRIHERIDGILTAVSELRGEIKHLS